MTAKWFCQKCKSASYAEGITKYNCPCCKVSKDLGEQIDRDIINAFIEEAKDQKKQE